ncbi:hypothetical protein PBN151_1908 [Paenibacillus sp. NAIST15-1]|nr:hypothetical protein PBN151_1908 [Paenibacillus sp. NAIST15-1]
MLDSSKCNVTVATISAKITEAGVMNVRIAVIAVKVVTVKKTIIDRAR